VDVPTLTCDDTWATSGGVSVVNCPTSCTTSAVVGTRYYSLDSSVCGAALHQGVIASMAPFSGDYQYAAISLVGHDVVAYDIQSNYTLVGSTRYGVTSTGDLVFGFVMTFAVSGSSINPVEENGFELDTPNLASGFGRVNLLNTISLPSQSPSRYIDILTVRTDDKVTDGSQMSYTVVSTGAGVLKFTLVWSDYPGSTTAAIALVNNLDLSVTSSACSTGDYDGTKWYGNGADADSLDDRNNVEQVVILDAPACTYTIVVAGTDVPQGPQKFALVAGGSDFTQSNDADTFASTGDDVTGWGGPTDTTVENDQTVNDAGDVNDAGSIRPFGALLVALAAVARML